MSMKIFLAGVFLINTLFGHICMMPMAHAKAMPMSQQHEEMAMTPLEPMSPAHCEHCLLVTEQQSQSTESGCAGYCLSKAADTSRAVVSTSQPFLADAALPIATPVLVSVLETNNGFIESTAPPGGFAPTWTVVLLQ